MIEYKGKRTLDGLTEFLDGIHKDSTQIVLTDKTYHEFTEETENLIVLSSKNFDEVVNDNKLLLVLFCK